MSEPFIEPTEENIGEGTAAGEAAADVISTAESLATAREEYAKTRDQAYEDTIKDEESKLEGQNAESVQETTSTLDPTTEKMTKEQAQSALDELNQLTAKARSIVEAMNGESTMKPETKTVLERIRQTFGKIFEKNTKKLDESMKKNDPDVSSKLDTTEMENAVKELNDATTDEEREAAEKKIDQAAEKLRKQLDKAGKTKKKVVAEGGESMWKRIRESKIASFLLKLTAIGGLLGGFIGFLYWWSHQLTGCYKYDGTNSEKISCPKDDDAKTSCNCSDAPADQKTAEQLNKVCADSKYDKFPFCCSGPSPAYPTCGSGTPGQQGVVYYAYQETNPATLIAGLPRDFTNLLKGLGNLGGLFGTIIKWILVGALILFSLYLLSIFVPKILKKFTENNQHEGEVEGGEGHVPTVTTGKNAFKFSYCGKRH